MTKRADVPYWRREQWRRMQSGSLVNNGDAIVPKEKSVPQSNEITIKITADTSEFDAACERLNKRLQNLERIYQARQAALDMEEAINRINDLLKDRGRLVARLREEAIDLEALEDRVDQ